MSVKTWVDDVGVGDLVFSKADGVPAIILDKQETARAKYGDIVNKRYRFKIHVDGEQGWITETSFRAMYKLP